jgi:hypothetical protein
VDGVSPDSTGNVSFDGANGIYVQPYGTSNVVQVASDFNTPKTETVEVIEWRNVGTDMTNLVLTAGEYVPVTLSGALEAQFPSGRRLYNATFDYNCKMGAGEGNEVVAEVDIYLAFRRKGSNVFDFLANPAAPLFFTEGVATQNSLEFALDALTNYDLYDGGLYIGLSTNVDPTFHYIMTARAACRVHGTVIYTRQRTVLHDVSNLPLLLQEPHKIVGTGSEPLITMSDVPPIPAPVVLYTTADITSPQITTKQQYLDFKASLPPFINHTVTFNFNAALATLGDDGGTFDLPGAGGSGTIRILNNYDNNFRDTTWRKCKCRLILGNDNPIIFRMTEYQNTSSLNFEDCFDVWVPAIETDPTGGVNIIYLGQLRTNNCTIGGLTSSSSGSVFFSTSCGNLVYANSTINSVTRYVRYYNHIQGHNVLDFPTYGGSFTQYYGYEKPIIFRGGGLV